MKFGIGAAGCTKCLTQFSGKNLKFILGNYGLRFDDLNPN
jgi:hypothetical protein